MAIAEQRRFETVKDVVQNHDATTILGYSIFSIALLIAIYFDSMSPGALPGDLSSMIVFP
jgi:hypothetical protein